MYKTLVGTAVAHEYGNVTVSGSLHLTLANSVCKALTVAAICMSCNSKEPRGELKRIWYNGSYNRDFKDLNDVHLEEAKRIGIKPASNREEAEKMKDDMEEIKTRKDEVVIKTNDITKLVGMYTRERVVRKWKEDVVDGNDVVKNFEAGNTLTFELDGNEVVLEKDDVLTQEVLNGAQFAVFNDLACTDPCDLWPSQQSYKNGDEPTNVFTIQRGSAYIWGLSPSRTYYIKEVAPPNASGYSPATGVIQLTLDKNGLNSYSATILEGVDEKYAADKAALERYISAGYIKRDGNKVSFTNKGFKVI